MTDTPNTIPTPVFDRFREMVGERLSKDWADMAAKDAYITAQGLQIEQLQEKVKELESQLEVVKGSTSEIAAVPSVESSS